MILYSCRDSIINTRGDILGFQYPKLATGKVLPEEGLSNAKISNLKEEAKIKRQFAHDWKIALFGTIGGAIAGLITSFIFWWITK